MSTSIQAAVELAEGQLAALRRDDVDGFLASLDAYEEACVSLGELSPPEVDKENILLLGQLIATDQLISAELSRAMADVSARLASMRRTRNAAEGYLAGTPSSITGVREG